MNWNMTRAGTNDRPGSVPSICRVPTSSARSTGYDSRIIVGYAAPYPGCIALRGHAAIFCMVGTTLVCTCVPCREIANFQRRYSFSSTGIHHSTCTGCVANRDTLADELDFNLRIEYERCVARLRRLPTPAGAVFCFVHHADVPLGQTTADTRH